MSEDEEGEDEVEKLDEMSWKVKEGEKDRGVDAGYKLSEKFKTVICLISRIKNSSYIFLF